MNEELHGTGHRKVMQLSLLFSSAHDPPFEPVHYTFLISFPNYQVQTPAHRLGGEGLAPPGAARFPGPWTLPSRLQLWEPLPPSCQHFRSWLRLWTKVSFPTQNSLCLLWCALLQYNVLQPLESETHPHPFRAPLPTAPQPLTQEDRDPEELVLFSSICPPIVSNVFKKENKTKLFYLPSGRRGPGRQIGRVETELALIRGRQASSGPLIRRDGRAWGAAHEWGEVPRALAETRKPLPIKLQCGSSGGSSHWGNFLHGMSHSTSLPSHLDDPLCFRLSLQRAHAFQFVATEWKPMGSEFPGS